MMQNNKKYIVFDADLSYGEKSRGFSTLEKMNKYINRAIQNGQKVSVRMNKNFK